MLARMRNSLEKWLGTDLSRRGQLPRTLMLAVGGAAFASACIVGCGGDDSGTLVSYGGSSSKGGAHGGASSASGGTFSSTGGTVASFGGQAQASATGG
jgi:hypothetical protein